MQLDHLEVCDQMQRAGLAVPPLPLRLGTERPVRFGPKKRCWYWLRELRTNGGRYVVVGAFGSWGQGTWRVDVDWQGISDEEREQLRQQQEAQRQADEAKRRARAARARMSAAERWRLASPRGVSAYLGRKLIEGAESCRFEDDGTLLVPLVHYAAQREQSVLAGLQAIAADGGKRFTPGFDKIGAACRLGHVVVDAPILVCEGYATGMTIRMALERRYPVFVALDAGNLQPVCERLRALHPHSRLLICADDDWQTDGNPGREHARKAARAVEGCDMVWPIFAVPSRMGERQRKDTDFNDLHARRGLNQVRRQLLSAIEAMGRARRAA